ncbi:MAG: zf-HC2 domain-containing protein [Gemmatimonadales bacterium]
MECEAVLFRLWEYLDRQVGPEEAVSIQVHLSGCPDCYPAYCCDRALLQLLSRQRTRCSAPAALIAAVRARIRIA